MMRIAARICLSAFLAIATSSLAGAAVIKTSVLWPKGSTLKVCFLDGNISQQQQVSAVASEWSGQADIAFDFGEKEKPRECGAGLSADIRVSLAGSGNWSYLGTDARGIPGGQPTLKTAEAVRAFENGDIAHFRLLVLHEFGHALGFVHEVQSPKAPCQLDLGALKIAINWSADRVQRDFGKIAEGAGVYVGPFDAKSVMLHDQTTFLVGGSYSGCYIVRPNTEVSAADKAALTAVYGPAAPQPRPAPPAVVAVPFRKPVEEAAIIGKEIIRQAIARGFSRDAKTPDPDQEVRSRLKSLAEDSLKRLATSVPNAAAAFHENRFGDCRLLVFDLAGNGNADAALVLAELSYEGLGLPSEDRAAAAHWIKQAMQYAGNGKPEAVYVLALMSGAGLGVSQDKDAAIKLLNDAGQAGYSQAYLRLGGRYLSEYERPDLMPPAIEAFRSAATQNDAVAKLALAVLAVEGFVGNDRRVDIKALIESAATTMAWAKFYKALLQADGTVFPKDTAAAAQALNEAADGGLAIAQTVLGFSYEIGQLNPPDAAQAAKWYWMAAQQEYPVAQFRLANLISSGKVPSGPYPAAKFLIRKAADAGLPEAQHQLAQMYRDSRDPDYNTVLAGAWYIIAASRLSGQEQAQAQSERDQVLKDIGPIPTAQAKAAARQISANADWANPEAKAMPPWIAGLPDTYGFTPKEQGSGFFIGKGYLLTDYHVVKGGCNLILATLQSGVTIPLVSPVWDEKHDLAILHTAELGDTGSVTWNFNNKNLPIDIHAAGFPLSKELESSKVTLEPGSVTQPGALHGDLSRWRISANIHRGNSGGPLFDQHGNVVGVAMGGWPDPEGSYVSFAFKGRLVQALFGDIIDFNSQARNSPLVNYFPYTILHEFGHALGLIHEHQGGNCQNEFNFQSLYKYYGWSQKMIDANFKHISDPRVSQLTPYCRGSVMNYVVDAAYYNKGAASVCYTPPVSQLADCDRQTATIAYPPPGPAKFLAAAQAHAIVATATGETPANAEQRRRLVSAAAQAAEKAALPDQIVAPLKRASEAADPQNSADLKDASLSLAQFVAQNSASSGSNGTSGPGIALAPPGPDEQKSIVRITETLKPDQH
jgi:TPR repeat protein